MALPPWAGKANKLRGTGGKGPSPKPAARYVPKGNGKAPEKKEGPVKPEPKRPTHPGGLQDTRTRGKPGEDAAVNRARAKANRSKPAAVPFGDWTEQRKGVKHGERAWAEPEVRGRNQHVSREIERAKRPDPLSDPEASAKLGTPLWDDPHDSAMPEDDPNPKHWEERRDRLKVVRKDLRRAAKENGKPLPGPPKAVRYSEDWYQYNKAKKNARKQASEKAANSRDAWYRNQAEARKAGEKINPENDARRAEAKRKADAKAAAKAATAPNEERAAATVARHKVDKGATGFGLTKATGGRSAGHEARRRKQLARAFGTGSKSPKVLTPRTASPRISKPIPRPKKAAPDVKGAQKVLEGVHTKSRMLVDPQPRPKPQVPDVEVGSSAAARGLGKLGGGLSAIATLVQLLSGGSNYEPLPPEIRREVVKPGERW